MKNKTKQEKRGGFSMLQNYLILRYSFTKSHSLFIVSKYVDYPFIS